MNENHQLPVFLPLCDDLFFFLFCTYFFDNCLIAMHENHLPLSSSPTAPGGDHPLPPPLHPWLRPPCHHAHHLHSPISLIISILSKMKICHGELAHAHPHQPSSVQDTNHRGFWDYLCFFDILPAPPSPSVQLWVGVQHRHGSSD